MKRLLLTPLLIALTGCSTDIVQKNSLGEKTIVKKSTVFVKDNTVNDIKELYEAFITRSKESVKIWSESVERCKKLEKVKYKACFDSDKKMYEEYYESALKSLEKDKARLKKYEPIFSKYKGTEIVRKFVTYQPIYQNINNIKTIGEEKTTDCINASLRDEFFQRYYSLLL